MPDKLLIPEDLFVASDFSIWLLQGCMTTPYICRRIVRSGPVAFMEKIGVRTPIIPTAFRIDRVQRGCHLNLTLDGDTKPSMRRDVILDKNVILNGKLDMKVFGSSLLGQAIKA